MIQLKDTRYANTAELLENAIQIASFYGFIPLEEAILARRGVRADRPSKETALADISYARRDERMITGAARSCAISITGERRSLFAWRIVQNTARGGEASVAIELHIAGIESAIAEAILITVSDAIVAAAGFTERNISINSIGTPDSSNRYVRDVGAYLRKHLETISPALRPRAAEDPLGTLIQLIERGHPAAARAPSSTEYLTEEERRRFWDLLEYLEVAQKPYELDHRVLGSRDCWAHTLFEINCVTPECGAKITVARGGRYDPLATRFAGTKAHGAAVTILCESRGRSSYKYRPEKVSAPLFYFAHLGPEARRKVLPVLEMLRLADIRVHQSLMHEKIGDQMTNAQRLGSPFILIMGHKEAVEGTMLVREMATNSQRAIPIEDLPGHLKRYKARV